MIPLLQQPLLAAQGYRTQGYIVCSTIQDQIIYFFVTNPADTIGRFHFDGGFYEDEELKIISRFYKRDSFLDIGANVGNHAIYVSKILGGSKVIVFEPNPVAIDLLKINLRLNNCVDVDTSCLGIALGNVEGRFQLETPDQLNLGHTVLSPSENGNIRGVRGDALLLDEPVGFAKVDVEGMELEILAGLKDTIARWRPTMFIEVWDGRADEFRRWCRNSNYLIQERYQRYPNINNYLITSA
jgi:FkbM family methyltransferase